ncbi:tail fiber domain-containing protein [candidate division KSB1 bacterium]|nr:tail fiber domain-containing protein [candidate division KSB1 bacterium]
MFRANLLIIGLLIQSFSFAQMVVENSGGDICMIVDSDGNVGVGTTQITGRIGMLSLGTNSYTWKNPTGSTIAGRAGLVVPITEPIDYNSGVKFPGIHSLVRAGADPNDYTGPKQDIAVSAHLLSPDLSKTWGVGNLAMNWALGESDEERRDISLVHGNVHDADEMVSLGDIRTVTAVAGIVQWERNTVDPDKVFAGYFRGAKSYFGNNVGFLIENPTHRIHVGGGAYCDGSSWVPGSSRDYKREISALSLDNALETLNNLNPVSFKYREDFIENSDDLKLGFIAEDVPDLLAEPGRKGVNPMDVIAVLTKIVQHQQHQINELEKIIGKSKTD